MRAALLAALVAGLLATPHCAAMCGGFASACAGHRGRGGAGLVAWHLGRLAGYAALGAAAGGMGRLLPGPGWIPGAVALLLLAWSAASLGGLLPAAATQPPALVRPVATIAGRLARHPGAGARLAFGAAVALLPCGMVYAALGAAVAGGGAATGAALMAAFGVGTLPGLTVVAAGLRRVAGSSLARRRVVAGLVFLAGAAVVVMRAGAVVHGHH